MVSDRHSLLLGQAVGIAAEAPSVEVGAQSDRLQKRGIFSEFLFEKQTKKIKSNFASSKYSPLPEINKGGAGAYSVTLPVSQTFVRDNVKQNNASNVKTLNAGVTTASSNAIAAEKTADYTEAGLVINYRKALEPKVARPFINRIDQTPRKIEMERKKRLYSSLDLKNLIDAELNSLKDLGHLPKHASHIKVKKSATVTETVISEDASLIQQPINREADDVSQLLPLEAFDDTEFDVRTVDDWLDMTSIPDDSCPENSAAPAFPKKARQHASTLRKGIIKPGFPDVRFAVVPLPAKAFDGLEWRDCIVIAYDDAQQLWKVKWRSYNGWELDKKSENAEGFIHPEDENLKEDFEVLSSDPRLIIDGKEIWTHR